MRGEGLFYKDDAMRFICTVSWEHSGIKSYLRDKMYDLDERQVIALANMKNKDAGNTIGAMRFFRPDDDEAEKKIAELQGKAGTGTGGTGRPVDLLTNEAAGKR
jgi:hypothetical protein